VQVDRIVGVIGAGPVGRRIAFASALGGYRTILEDTLPSSLRKAGSEFQSHLEDVTQSARVSLDAVREATARLQYASTLEEAARQADLIIEAMPEELESKIEIFTLLDKICRPLTIFVTTSAETTVTQLAGITYRAARCIGLRLASPASGADHIEVVRGRQTSNETFDIISNFAHKIGREVAVVDERTVDPE
jgi:3-hydroxybutyryl-CoA dehydrogenase